MPKIAQVENTVGGLQPSDRGVDALQQSARRIGAFASQMAGAVSSVGDQIAGEVSSTVKAVGNVVLDYEQHKEIADGGASYAQLNDRMTQAWNDRVQTADPRDTSVVEDFRQNTLEPALQDFTKQFGTKGGQEWGERRVEALRNHMFEKTTADMSSRAADALTVNVRQTSNELTNTAVNDPSSVPHSLATVDDWVGSLVDSSPYLKGAAGSKAKAEMTQQMKEKIVQGGAMSAIQKSSNPEATAAEWSAKYPDYINGAETLTLAKAARTQLKLTEATAKAERVAQKQLETQDADHAGAQLIGSVIKPDGTVDDSKKPELLKNLHDMIMPGNKDADGKSTYKPGMTTGKALELFKFASGEDIVKSSTPDVKLDLQNKLYANELDPMDIIKAVNNKQLSHTDAGIMEAQRKLIEEHPIQDKGFATAMKGAEASLVLPTAHSDFMQDFLPQYLNAKAKGELKPGDLNFSDPNSMISKALATHQPTQAEKVQYQTLKNVGMGLSGDLNKNMEIINAPKVPATMSKADAIKQYGGKLVNMDGVLIRLPKE